MIKKILPFEEIVYRSKLNKEELVAHLQNEIEAEKAFGFGANRFVYTKPYIGKIFDNRFEIKRAINYRNSFLPVIKGEIRNDLSGSKILVKMNLVELIKVFMIIWLVVVFTACLGVSYSLLFSHSYDSEAVPFIFIPYFMLLFGVVLVSFGFKSESKKSINDLEEILQAKIIQR